MQTRLIGHFLVGIAIAIAIIDDVLIITFAGRFRSSALNDLSGNRDGLGLFPISTKIKS
jgi:hypothetical protein